MASDNTPDNRRWFDSSLKPVTWASGLITFIFLLMDLLKRWTEETDRMSSVVIALLVLGGLLGCTYVVWRRTTPKSHGDKRRYQYPRLRPWGFVGLLFIP